MQFGHLFVTLLPALAATATATPTVTVTPRAAVVSSEQECPNGLNQSCAASTDGLHRCLIVGGANVCVIDCGSQTACRTSCINAGFINGFCTTGDNPCVCSNSDASGSS